MVVVVLRHLGRVPACISAHGSHGPFRDVDEPAMKLEPTRGRLRGSTGAPERGGATGAVVAVRGHCSSFGPVTVT